VAPQKSVAVTMGIEEEFFVVEQTTGELAHGGWHEIAATASGERVNLTPEIYREMIEVRTAVHGTLQPLLDEQEHNRRALVASLRPHAKCLLGCGTHPLESWRNTKLEDEERYRELVSGYGLCLQRALTCGMHMHFGFESPALMMAAYGLIRAYLPIIAAASASSPYWLGHHTRLQSYRRAVFDALPRSGLPPRVRSLSEYVEFCAALEDIRYLSNGTTVWWDARLNVKHGTLEIRVPDTVPELRRAQAVAILTALCIEQSLSSAPLVMDEFLIQENRWRATKFGMRARLFCGALAQQQMAIDCIDRILERGRGSPLIADCGWNLEEVRAGLLETEEPVDEDGNDGPDAARRYLEGALRRTAACGQGVSIREVA
jgi:glutamate---cysteine ligase / carboxylate-amine ligase